MLVAEIAQYLQGLGILVFDEGGASGDTFIAALPSTPDECVMIRATGGAAADPLNAFEHPTVQVIVRGDRDPRTAETRANDIYNALHGFSHDRFVASTGTWIVACQGIQSAPQHIGRDENGRHEYSLNFRLTIRNDDRRH